MTCTSVWMVAGVKKQYAEWTSRSTGANQNLMQTASNDTRTVESVYNGGKLQIGSGSGIQQYVKYDNECDAMNCAVMVVPMSVSGTVSYATVIADSGSCISRGLLGGGTCEGSPTKYRQFAPADDGTGDGSTSDTCVKCSQSPDKSSAVVSDATDS